MYMLNLFSCLEFPWSNNNSCWPYITVVYFANFRVSGRIFNFAHDYPPGYFRDAIIHPPGYFLGGYLILRHRRRSFRALFFDFGSVIAAITATFLAVVDQSTSCTLIGRFRFNCSCHAVVILCFAIHGDCFIHK